KSLFLDVRSIELMYHPIYSLLATLARLAMRNAINASIRTMILELGSVFKPNSGAPNQNFSNKRSEISLD
ncbi:MAG: hypothetical protein MHPSP_004143, partial [Paramarteilia canceri]